MGETESRGIFESSDNWQSKYICDTGIDLVLWNHIASLRFAKATSVNIVQKSMEPVQIFKKYNVWKSQFNRLASNKRKYLKQGTCVGCADVWLRVGLVVKGLRYIKPL